MDEQRKKKELLDELARRFRESQEVLKGIAAQVSKSVRNKEAESFDTFTILEFIEFTSADEFRKFREQPRITREDLENVDLDDLCWKLLEGEGE